MSEVFKLEDSKIKPIIFLATPFAFLCAILYLYSFWSRFHINFLEFLTLADLLIISIYPIFGTLLSLGVGFVIGRIFPDKRKISEKRAKRRLVLVSLALIFISIESGLLYGWHQLYVFTPFLIAIWSSFPLEKYLLSKDISFPWQLLLFIILIPLLCYGIGALESHKILQNQSVRYAEISQFQNNELFKTQSKIKYIGLGGKHYFFISEDNSNLYVMNSEKVSLLELSKPSSEKFESPWKKLKKWFNEDQESKPEVSK